MRYFLENELFKVEIDSHGAEVKSVLNKKSWREYMWYGNKKFWGRTSPVLFPFVGSLRNKEYHWKGHAYPMGQHGFARDFEHELISQTEDTIWFSFHSDETTLARYPFPFELQCGYQLSGNALKVLWRVRNTDSGAPMYFSIGAHPAFLCPIHGEKNKAGYRLFFQGVDEMHYHGNDVPSGMALPDESILPLENGRVTITEEFFDRCTYFFEDHQTTMVGLEDADGNRIVDVEFDTPLFAIWSPEGKNAPFLCIEPWFGRCDAYDFEGELNERAFTNKLEAGDEFSAEYVLRFY